MIDIHCHILPDVDDGAADMAEALEMARMAARSGVTDIVTTPHFRGEVEQLFLRDSIDRRFRVLRDALAREEIPVRLHPGAEVLCLPETGALAARYQLPTLGDSGYVLIEFYFDEAYAVMDQALAEIAECGYKIVVAHPERYGAIQRDPLRLERWARFGYVLQLNKGSVLGAFGHRPEQAANEILELGLAHLFATDAHSCDGRTPHVGMLRRWVEECCDERYAKILLEENPRRVLQGRPMVGRG